MNPTKQVREPWWQLTCEVPHTWGDDAAACLIEAGALGVQIVDEGPEPPPAFAKHAVTPRPLEHRPGFATLVASYASGHNLAREAADALSELGLQIDPAGMQVIQRDDYDWAERWKQYFKPIKIGRRMWIVPTWEKAFAPPTGSIVLWMDPGMAFGTGQHATTALCLRAIEKYADALPPPVRGDRRMLDLGCGTGVLGIGACKLGIGRATALDIDPEAVAATQENARLNDVEARMVIADTDVAKVSDTFHLVVANILAAPLMEMAESIVRRLQSKGILVLSGILATQADEVLRAYEKGAGRVGRRLQHTHRWTHGEWVALAFAEVP